MKTFFNVEEAPKGVNLCLAWRNDSGFWFETVRVDEEGRISIYTMYDEDGNNVDSFLPMEEGHACFKCFYPRMDGEAPLNQYPVDFVQLIEAVAL